MQTQKQMYTWTMEVDSQACICIIGCTYYNSDHINVPIPV